MIDINLKPKVGKIEAGTLVQCTEKSGDGYHKYGIVSSSPCGIFLGVVMLNDDGSLSDYFDHYKESEDLFKHFKIVAQKENYNMNISLK